MSLQQTIEQDFQTAQKAKDQTTVGTLRLLKSAILVKEKEGAQAGQPLDDDAVLAIVKQQVKQRKESIAEYEKAGRAELVATEQAELALLEKYLPEQLPEAEIRAMAETVIAENSGQDFGPVMGQVMKAVAGRADGAIVQKIVKELMQ